MVIQPATRIIASIDKVVSSLRIPGSFLDMRVDGLPLSDTLDSFVECV